MAEFELPSGNRDQMGADVASMEAFYNQALIHQSSASRKYSKRNRNVKITEDEEGAGDNVIIETDRLHKVFHNNKIFEFLEDQFFHYNWKTERPDRVGATIYVNDKVYTGDLRFNKVGRYYTVHLREFSKDWAERDLNSSDVKDWLTDYGVVQFEAMKEHFASGEAVSFGELLAPQGMLILVEFEKLFYLMDDKKQWRISYSDFKEAIKQDEGNYREIKIKRFRDNRHYTRMGDVKVRVYLIPDGRIVMPTNFNQEQLERYAEMGIEPPKEQVRNRAIHWELATPRGFAKGEYFRILKESQKQKRKFDGQQMELLLMLFEEEDQREFKKSGNYYLRKYVYKYVDRDEMARAIFHFSTSIFTLKEKLTYVKHAGSGSDVNLNTIRPLLAQYDKSRKLAVTHSKRRTGEDEANIDRLIRESEYKLAYTEPNYIVGKYDDVLDESIGIAGLESVAVQDRLIRLQDAYEWYNLYYNKKDKTAAEEKLKELGEKYDYNNAFTATNLYGSDSKWYLKLFRDNAEKIAFMMLDTAELVVQEQTRDYFNFKYFQLERDFLEYQDALEVLVSAKHQKEIDGVSGGLQEFLVDRHPFLIDIEINGFSSHTLLQIGRVYKKYKEDPKNFRTYFLRALTRSMGDRLNSIAETKEKLRSDAEFVWELESLIAMTRGFMHNEQDSFLDAIIEKHLKKREEDEFKRTLGLTIAAITLTIVSGGLFAAGASALLAGTYAAGGLVLTGQMVYDAHKNDSALRHANNIGNQYTPYGMLTQKDPSIGWLVFDIAMLGLDMISVIKVFRAVSPVAKIVSNADEVVDVSVDLQKTLKQLTEEVAGFKQSHAAKIERKIIAQQEFKNSLAHLESLQGASGGLLSLSTSGTPKLVKAWADVMQKAINLGVKNVDEFFDYFIKKQQLKKVLKQHIKDMPEEDRKYLQIMFDDMLGNTKDVVARLAPESGYLRGGYHGLLWPEKKAFLRAQDLNKSQGKFGSMEDIAFAGEKAILLEPEGFMDFPFPNNQSKVYLTDGKTILDADMVRVRNNGDGTFHGFPIHSQYAEPIYKLAKLR